MSKQRFGSPFPSYIGALDGLRGLAVLAVVFFHLALYASGGAAGEVSGTASGGALFAIARFGWVGVDLFFVLSGFLITGILFDHRESRSRLRAFYGRRLLRIVPLYYVALILYAAVIPLLAAPDQIASFFDALPWHVTYLTNFRISFAQDWAAAPMHTSHLWSLAVEEQFYLLWPGLVALTVRWAKDPRQSLMRVCGLLVVGSIAFRLWMLPGFVHGAYTLLPARMDTLAVGAFLALWSRGPDGAKSAVAASGPVLIVCGLALVLLAVLSAGSVSYFHPLQQGAGYTLWAAVFGCVVIRAAAGSDPRVSSLLTTRALVLTGQVSYGLYLIHYPVIYVLDNLGWRGLGFLPFCVSVLVVSFGLAHLSWRYLETPILRLKRHFPYDRANNRSSVSADNRPPATRRRTSGTTTPVPSG